MRMKATFFYLLVLLVGFGTAVFSFQSKITPQQSIQPTPTPEKIKPFTMYHAPHIPKKSFYKIAMVGDSMTSEIGQHGGAISDKLNVLYKSVPGDQRILIDNYARPSTSVLSLSEQLNTKLTIGKDTYEPLLSQPYDLILIESFGYNPLSEYALQDGLKKQTQILEDTMTLLSNKYPSMAVIFVATIAPNKELYAKEILPQLTAADRLIEVEERNTYIKNHIAFAEAHGIPLIDIFDASLTKDGDGNLLYINPTDHIHPSFAGIDFIGQHIADAIYNSHILPE